MMAPKCNYSLKGKKALGIFIPLIFLTLLALFIISLPRWAVIVTIILGLLALNAFLGIIFGSRIHRAKTRCTQAIAKILRDKEIETVLDLGSGAGILTIHLAKNGFQTSGVDIDKEALHQARRNAEREGVKTEFLVGDGSSLKWADNSFDAITSLNLLHETKDPQTVLAESYRVLKPGGTLVMADFRRSPAIFTIFWVGIFKFLSRKNLFRLLQEAGFEKIQISKVNLFHHLVLGRKKK